MSWQESDSKSVSNPHNGQDLKSERTVLWLDISLALCLHSVWKSLKKQRFSKLRTKHLMNIARFARTDETFLRSFFKHSVWRRSFFLYANTLGNLGKPRGIGLGCVFASAEAKIIFYFLGQELGLEFKWLVVVENWLSLLLSALPRGCIYTACCFPRSVECNWIYGW